MALSIYLTITILLLHVAFYIKKPLNFMENSLVFMVIAIITRQCLTLSAMEWGLFKMTEDDWLFVCLLLCRDLFTPMICVIFVNFYVRGEYKIASFLISLAVLLGLHELAVQLGILTYIHWNFFYTILLNTGFLLAALGVLKLIYFIKIRENRQNENI